MRLCEPWNKPVPTSFGQRSAQKNLRVRMLSLHLSIDKVNSPMLPFRVLVRHPTRSFPSASHAKRTPSFSITCALFSIHNFVHPLCFVKTAHSSAKAPGGGAVFSNKIFTFPLNPTESISFADPPSNPFRILFFRKQGWGWLVPPSVFSPRHRRPTGQEIIRNQRTSSSPSARRLKTTKAILS